MKLKLFNLAILVFFLGGTIAAQTKLVEKITKKDDGIVIPYEKYKLILNDPAKLDFFNYLKWTNEEFEGIEFTKQSLMSFQTEEFFFREIMIKQRR